MGERKWRKLTVTLPSGAPPEAVEAAADFLVGLTGRGIVTDEGPGGEARLTAWAAPAEGEDPVAALARFGGELAAMGLLDSPPAVAEIEAGEEDWMAVFRAQHSPVRVSSRLVVRPSWCASPGGPGREIVIDPGLAFGVGTHATTRLTLFLIDQAIADRPPARMLDLGTGTGVLAIAGSFLGAGEIVAADNDPVAIEVARANAAANGVPAEGAGSVCLLVSTLEGIAGRFDLITANLSTPVLESIAGGLAAALAPGGRLLASGIAAPEEPRALAAFAAAGLRPREILRDEGWVAMVLAGAGAG